MKKNLLLVVVCTLFVTSAYAQERGFGYGIKAGVNIAKVTNMGVDSKVGFTGGIFVDYRFSKVFALSAERLYKPERFLNPPHTPVPLIRVKKIQNGHLHPPTEGFHTG